MTAVPTTPPKQAPHPPPNNSIGFAILAAWLAAGYGLTRGLYVGPLTFAFVMLGWVLSVMAHEFAHAAVAYAGGDHSVRGKGYLAFDPRRYGDLGVSLVLPLIFLALGGIGFPGGAVYLREDLMRNRLWRSAAALAGPAATFLILLALCAVLAVGSNLGDPLFSALAFLAFLQATALILNLLPLPGLDGFGAIRPFLPNPNAPALRRIEGLAMLVLFLAVFLTPWAGAFLFGGAARIVHALGVPFEALGEGWRNFRFWS